MFKQRALPLLPTEQKKNKKKHGGTIHYFEEICMTDSGLDSIQNRTFPHRGPSEDGEKNKCGEKQTIKDRN